MPTYNREEYISQAVESYKIQDYPNKELIILDNNSDIAYATKYESKENNIKVYRLDNNYFGRINHGIEFATGDIITMLHDDDKFYDEKSLSHRMKPFNDSQDVEVVFTSWVKMDRFGNAIGSVNDCGNVSLKNLLEKEYIYHPTMAWRKEIDKKFSIADDNFIASYDTIFKVNCLFECNCMPVHEPTIMYRIHEGQESFKHGQSGQTRMELDMIKTKIRKYIGQYL